MGETQLASEPAERFALALAESGMQRMVARVLAAFLFSDRESITAGELGEQLGASAGSISGAITMLRTVALIEETPLPGSRRTHYRMRDDAWATLLTSKNATFAMMQEVAEAGLAVVPTSSPARVRLEQMRDFYGYILTALPAIVDRWHGVQGSRGPYPQLVTIVVDDYDSAIAFFVDVLGFELVEDSPASTNDGRPKRWVVVRPPGAETGVLLTRADGTEQAAAVGQQVAGRVGFFLRVDDFDAAFARLRAAGVEFVRAPRTESYGTVAVFLDIAGNRWDLVGPPGSESST